MDLRYSEIQQQTKVETGKKIFCNLYGSLNAIPMKELRYKLFTSKSTPDVKTLTPTDGPLLQHYQVFIWKSASTATPTHLNSTDWGWELIDDLIKPVLGKVVACTCQTENPCSTKRCSGNNVSGISCTSFCKCNGGRIFGNCFTKHDF